MVKKLSQEEIISFLKEHKNQKYDAVQISDILNKAYRIVYKSLRDMRSNKSCRFELIFSEETNSRKLVYWHEDPKTKTPLNELKEINDEPLSRETEKIFNTLYSELIEIDSLFDKLQEKLNGLNNNIDKIRISYLSDLDKYHAKDKLKEKINKIRYKARKVRVFKL